MPRTITSDATPSSWRTSRAWLNQIPSTAATPRSAAVSSKRFSILCQILELRRPWGAMILQLSRRSDIQRRPSRIPIMRQAAPVNAKAMNGCSRTKAAL